MPLPTLAFTEPVGSADAPLIVLGPSLGTSSILWERVVPLLSDAFRLTAWDLPGHGASPVASAPFTVADLADAVATAVRALGADEIRYAGVSLGGATGLALAQRHPDLVAGAAIVASGAYLGDPGPWLDRATLVRAESTSVLVDQSTDRWFTPDAATRIPQLSTRLLQVLSDADDDSYARCCEALATYDMRAGLASITVPILAVWGESDPVVAEPAAIEIAHGVQKGDTVRITGAAHLPPAEQPEAVAAALREFFSAAS